MAVKKIYKGSSVVNNLSVGSTEVKKVVVINSSGTSNTVYEKDFDTYITVVTPAGTVIDKQSVAAGTSLITSTLLGKVLSYKSSEYKSNNLYYYDVPCDITVTIYDENNQVIRNIFTTPDDFYDDLAYYNCDTSGTYYHIKAKVDSTSKVAVMLAIDVYYYMSFSYSGLVFTKSYHKGSTYSQIITDSGRPAGQVVNSGGWKYTYTYHSLRFDDDRATINSSDRILTNRAVEYYYSSTVEQIPIDEYADAPSYMGVYLRDRSGTWEQVFLCSSNSWSPYSGSDITVSGTSGAFGGYNYSIVMKFWIVTNTGTSSGHGWKTAISGLQQVSCSGIYIPESEWNPQGFIHPVPNGSGTGVNTIRVCASSKGTYNLGKGWLGLKTITTDGMSAIIPSLARQQTYNYYRGIVWVANNSSSSSGGGD